MITWVDVSLNAWASWAISQARREVGYPSVSPMFKDAPSGRVFESHEPGVIRADLMQMDRAVMALPSLLKVVVVEYYQRRRSANDAAKALGVRKTQMYRYLDQAHLHIANHFDAVSVGG